MEVREGGEEEGEEVKEVLVEVREGGEELMEGGEEGKEVVVGVEVEVREFGMESERNVELRRAILERNKLQSVSFSQLFFPVCVCMCVCVIFNLLKLMNLAAYPGLFMVTTEQTLLRLKAAGETQC